MPEDIDVNNGCKVCQVHDNGATRSVAAEEMRANAGATDLLQIRLLYI